MSRKEIYIKSERGLTRNEMLAVGEWLILKCGAVGDTRVGKDKELLPGWFYVSTSMCSGQATSYSISYHSLRKGRSESTVSSGIVISATYVGNGQEPEQRPMVKFTNTASGKYQLGPFVKKLKTFILLSKLKAA